MIDSNTSGLILPKNAKLGYFASKPVYRSFIVFGMYETCILFLQIIQYVEHHSSYRYNPH